MKSKTKKIAIIDHTGKYAGMDYYSINLAKGLRNAGCLPLIYSNFDAEKLDFPVENIFEFNEKRFVKKVMNRLVSYRKAAVKAKKEQAEYAIIHLFHVSYLTAFQFFTVWLTKLPVVAIFHDVDAFGKKEKPWLKKLMLNKFSRKIVLHNHYCSGLLQKRAILNDDSKMMIIKHGGFIEPNFKLMDRKTVQQQYNLPGSKKYLLFFGQVKDEKGLDVAIKALKHLPGDVHLIVAGRLRIKDFSGYQKIIDDHNLKERIILHLRYIENDEIIPFYSMAEAVIMPYRKIFQSGVLLASMSRLVPVIASDLEPNKEVIRHAENGFLFKSEDEHDLAENIVHLLQLSKEEKDHIIQKAFETIEKEYSWDRIAKEYVNINFN